MSVPRVPSAGDPAIIPLVRRAKTRKIAEREFRTDGDGSCMNIIVEIDGPVLDVAPAWYRAHREAAAKVGWAALDRPTFWRLTRKQGREANLLRGAKPVKIKAYHAAFNERLEADETVATYESYEGVDRVLASLASKGSVRLVTLGSNVDARRAILKQHDLMRCVERVERLTDDPRKRPGELRILTAGEPRSLVVASGDSLMRAAGEADIPMVGVPRGPCSKDRLHRAGADVMFTDIEDVWAAIAEGSQELERAGLLPPAIG